MWCGVITMVKVFLLLALMAGVLNLISADESLARADSSADSDGGGSAWAESYAHSSKGSAVAYAESSDDAGRVSADSFAETWSDDMCVPEPPKCTKPNEVLDNCPGTCPLRTCGFDDRVAFCPRQPEPGDEDCPEPKCRCQSGYYRDDKMNCVPWDQCPTCTGPFEIYDPCDTSCPARTCAFDGTLVRCKARPKLGDDDCIPGCRCQDGYLKNDKNVCIPEDQCPKKCYKSNNEVYDPCPSSDPQKCSTIGKRFNRPLVPANTTDSQCKGACRCIEGYARDNNNDCVPIEYCSKCKRANEVYEVCPDCSPQTCETRDRVYKCDISQCKPACRCKRGYFRNKIGQCQSAEDCAKCPGTHEFFSCGSACDNRCDSKFGRNNCNIQNIVCNPMCYCEDDYARATNGTCIPKTDCQYECPVNERYVECPSDYGGPKKCSEAGFPLPISGPRKAGDPCPVKPGCLCNDGFLRNDKGVCVLTEDCPSCGGDQNSTLGCGGNCRKTCASNNENKACILVCYPNTCDCRPDYIYDGNIGQCVLPQDCTPQCKKNEVYSTCSNGGCQKKKCTDLNREKVCINVKECEPGCLCAPGFLRAKNGTCVPTLKCDVPLPVCKANAEFTPCGLDGCLKKYCSDLDLPPLCRDTFTCDPGCECKEGFLRASYDDDTCVAIDDCPRKCPKNEIFVDCPASTCGPQNCSQIKDPYSCPSYSECPGEPGCICASGYLRACNGTCISQEKCPEAACGTNEEFSTCSNSLCRVQSCADKGKTQPCQPMAPESCTTGCVCPKGFLRNKNNICVPEDQCEPPVQCPQNEVLSGCPQAICGPQTCAQAGFPIACPIYKKCPGEPGCVCQPNYLRNAKGVCIPKEKCPSCGGDNNAIPGCGNCGNRCSDLNSTTPVACKAICDLNGCNCRKGYYHNGKKCVKPDQCQQCPKHERFVQCAETMCQLETCKEAGTTPPCPILGPKGQCPGKPRCICIDGYLRNDKRVCIPKKQCQGRTTTKPSPVYTCNVEAVKQELIDGNTEFTGKFFYQVVKSNPGKSVFMSTYSVLLPLAQLLMYSKGSTYDQLASALNVQSKDDIRCGFRALLESVTASEGTVLDTPSKIYVYKQGKLSESLEKDAKKIFRSEVGSVDFTEPYAASETINNWVSNATREKITELVKPDMFDHLTRIVLVNAIYFKGLWQYEFDPSNTKPRDFYTSNGKTIQVPTMTQKGRFNYAELNDPDVQALEIPYKDEDISFLVILPKQKDGLLSVVEKLQDPKVFQKIINSLSQQKVTIYIPKITQLETKINLKDILVAVGITDIFHSEKAQLDGMTDSNQPLYVSEAVQKAFVTVDEKGSEAAAANVMRLGPMGPAPPPVEFVFNAKQPFIFMIKHNNIVLFTGSKAN